MSLRHQQSNREMGKRIGQSDSDPASGGSTRRDRTPIQDTPQAGSPVALPWEGYLEYCITPNALVQGQVRAVAQQSQVKPRGNRHRKFLPVSAGERAYVGCVLAGNTYGQIFAV